MAVYGLAAKVAYKTLVALVVATVAAVDNFSVMVFATMAAPVLISAAPLIDNAIVNKFCASAAAFDTSSLSSPNKLTAAVAAANADEIPPPNLLKPSTIFSVPSASVVLFRLSSSFWVFEISLDNSLNTSEPISTCLRSSRAFLNSFSNVCMSLTTVLSPFSLIRNPISLAMLIINS